MNNVQLLGYVASDPFQTQNPDKCNPTLFNLIVHEQIQRKQYQQFIPCKAWGKMGEAIKKLVKCGSRIVVEGRLTTSVLTKKDDESNTSMVVNAEIAVKNFWLLQDPKPKYDPVETDGL